MPDVQKAAEGGPASVHPEPVFLNGYKFLLFASQCVVKGNAGFLFDCKQGCAQVPLAAIRQDDHNTPFFHFTCHLERPGQSRPRAHARKYALLFGKSPGGRESFLVIDIDDSIGPLLFKYARPIGLFHVFQALDFVTQIGLYPNDLNSRLQFFESPGKSHECPGCAHAGHHSIQVAGCLLPDFQGRAVIMGLPVGVVVKLVGKPVFSGVLSYQIVNKLDGPIRAQVSGGELQISPHGSQNLLSLLTHRL